MVSLTGFLKGYCKSIFNNVESCTYASMEDLEKAIIANCIKNFKFYSLFLGSFYIFNKHILKKTIQKIYIRK